MPHCKVAGVQRTAEEQLPRGLGVLVVLLRAEVAVEDDLADLLAVSLHFDQVPGWLVWVVFFGSDDSHWQGCHGTVALAGHTTVLFLHFQVVPERFEVTFRDWPVRFCQAIHVHRVQIEVLHGFEQVSGRRARCNCDADRLCAKISKNHDEPPRRSNIPGSFSAFGSAHSRMLTVGAALKWLIASSFNNLQISG